MEKELALLTSRPPLACLHRNSVVSVTDRLDMASAVYSGGKANKMLHFSKAIRSMLGRLDVLSFDVYKKTTDLNPLVTNGFSRPIIWTCPLSF